MIKATDLIKKVDAYQVGDDICTDLSLACEIAAYSIFMSKGLPVSGNLSKLARFTTRFEREFLRANKKPKFIILYDCTELVNMNIFAWDTGFDTPYYENAVFESKEEARKVAESENLQSFVIVEVNNDMS